MQKEIQSIGIIMDGNRRWARSRGLDAGDGHKAGYEALVSLARELPRLRAEYGLRYVTIYAFSTENWNRSEEEVNTLLSLFKRGMEHIADELDSIDVAVRAIGDLARFPDDLQKSLRAIEEKTTYNTGGVVAFALSYGGRAEIMHAARSLAAESGDITEERFDAALWTAGIPDPDLIIRTSGEMRLSGFLPWQSVYSELFFVDTLWPDFTVADLEKIFAEYAERERRHGK